jgi:hypothetical protein
MNPQIKTKGVMIVFVTGTKVKYMCNKMVQPPPDIYWEVRYNNKKQSL